MPHGRRKKGRKRGKRKRGKKASKRRFPFPHAPEGGRPKKGKKHGRGATGGGKKSFHKKATAGPAKGRKGRRERGEQPGTANYYVS